MILVTKTPTVSESISSGWTGISSVYASDNVRAVTKKATAIMVAKGFGFTIPSDALSVNSIDVSVEGFGSGSTADKRSIQVALTKNGTSPIGNWSPAIDLGTTEKTILAGSGLWGTSFLPAEINSSNFGVLLKIAGTANYNRNIDQVQVSVQYMPFVETPAMIKQAILNKINALRVGVGAAPLTYNFVVEPYTQQQIDNQDAISCDLAHNMTNPACPGLWAQCATMWGLAYCRDYAVDMMWAEENVYGTHRYILQNAANWVAIAVGNQCNNVFLNFC